MTVTEPGFWLGYRYTQISCSEGLPSGILLRGELSSLLFSTAVPLIPKLAPGRQLSRVQGLEHNSWDCEVQSHISVGKGEGVETSPWWLASKYLKKGLKSGCANSYLVLARNLPIWESVKVGHGSNVWVLLLLYAKFLIFGNFSENILIM